MVCIHNHGVCIHNNGIRCASITSVHSVSCASIIVHLDYRCTPTLVSATCASIIMVIDAHPSKSTCTLTVCIHAWMHTLHVHPCRYYGCTPTVWHLDKATYWCNKWQSAMAFDVIATNTSSRTCHARLPHLPRTSTRICLHNCERKHPHQRSWFGSRWIFLRFTSGATNDSPGWRLMLLRPQAAPILATHLPRTFPEHLQRLVA